MVLIISNIDFWAKLTSFREGKSSSVVHSPYYMVNTGGQSIASIYDLGGIFTLVFRASIN